jgi:hypothetical protein
LLLELPVAQQHGQCCCRPVVNNRPIARNGSNDMEIGPLNGRPARGMSLAQVSAASAATSISKGKPLDLLQARLIGLTSN